MALLLLLVSATLTGPVADLARGHRAYRAGEYREAARALAAAAARPSATRDYALYLAAESEFYAGAPARARALFAELAKQRGSRLAALAPWRMADCLWAEGRRGEAVAAYRRLVASRPPAGIDPVVGRFRIAEVTGGEEGRRLLRQIHVEHPAHPLAAEAARRAGAVTAAADGPVAPRERLRRAQRLAEGKHYEAALAELAELPPDLPLELRVERDFEIGMAKYRMRRDYAGAAALLLGVVPHLPADRAAFAAFHGARALSRADRDDEAIAGYLRVVERFPASRWAAEAQFLAGWLDFNRGRFREALPGLRATLRRYGRTSFARDAAWFLALAHHFGGEPEEALAALAEHARLAGNDAEAGRRVAYWRGRLLAGGGRTAEARALWRELWQRAPLTYYGLLARARLREAGEPAEIALARREIALAPPGARALGDPAVVRADELARAGLVEEAGVELQRAEEALEKRLGRPQALALLLDRYPRMQAFRRAYQLAMARGGEALQAAPVGPARVLWEAGYPRAFRPVVEKQAGAAGVPPLFLWAIMHKESGFGPHVVSYADARGLLQVIPTLGAEVSAAAGLPFFVDELFDPEANVRIGAAHIGELVRRFEGQLLLAAGAYNGGSRPMLRWLAQNGRRPLDEFVELVTYEQTREYMKRVIGIYARYLYLYEGKVHDLPLALDAAHPTD